MDDIIKHLVTPFLNHPQDLSFNLVEGKGSILIELKLHEEDVSSFSDDNRFAVQHMISLGTGKKKPTISVVDEFTVEEESSDSDSATSSSEETAAAETENEAAEESAEAEENSGE